ncbi:hypothetical protein BT67DRAFT_379651 [Trichocladium antarcticum]|uniref:Uncharacterized protein n=1 Tax=Trichocladium antarcticum TaxID=1450529 RepID=A0AAN6UKH4_9PEZI|nr:hypothetical protein BT67DRAFT_379651 [Trichocladium antarcticum]
MAAQPPSRLLSTHARVHPPYLPYLNNASRTSSKSMKWVTPLAAVVCAGYAVASYREAQVSARLAAADSAATATAAQRRRDAQMADAYGDRGSLEALERAMRVYEAQQGNE